MTLKAKIRWPKGSAPAKQFFCFPIPLIRYVADNPSSPRVYHEMIQTCKYFFDRNPILLVAYMTETSICLYGEEDCDNNKAKCCVNFDNINIINKIISKFWLFGELDVTDAPDFISSLIPKIYRNDIYKIELDKFLSVHDTLKLLTSNIRHIDFWAANSTNDEGNTVMLKEILEAAPEVEIFELFLENINVTIGKNIAKLNYLRFFELINIPESCDVEDLTNFIMNHKHTKINLRFEENLSEEYKTQIDALIDTVIESKIQCRIQYDGQSEEIYKIMKGLYNAKIDIVS